MASQVVLYGLGVVWTRLIVVVLIISWFKALDGRANSCSLFLVNAHLGTCTNLACGSNMLVSSI